MRPASRHGERGSTLLEVMIAMSILIVASTGFAGMSRYAAASTHVGHGRTSATFLRAGLIDRLQVMPRSVLRGIAASNKGSWLVDGCYDVSAQRVAGGRNDTYSPAFQCPGPTAYRTWIRVTDNDTGAGAWATTTNTWNVGLYVERMNPGCSGAQRYSTVGCVAADVVLTD